MQYTLYSQGTCNEISPNFFSDFIVITHKKCKQSAKGYVYIHMLHAMFLVEKFLKEYVSENIQIDFQFNF